MDTEKHLLKLCRAALGEDTPEDAALLSSLDGDAWTAVYRLAKHHDLGHLVAAAGADVGALLRELGLPCE